MDEPLTPSNDFLAIASSPPILNGVMPGRHSGARPNDHAPLRLRAPRRFARWVQSYADLLGQRLKLSTNHGDVVALAGQLAAGLAGPRDLMDLHAASLRGPGSLSREGSASEQRSATQRWLEEDRLLLLELMGRLAENYRDQLLQATRREPECRHG
jgi:hypothetical protein